MRQRTHFATGLVALALAAGLLSACGGSSATATPTAGPSKPVIATDANGVAIAIPSAAPQRIVSLTPGNSEMLAAIGETSAVVGVDAFTDYPEEIAAKPKVTDPSAFGKTNLEQIISLKPDLVLSYSKYYADDEAKLRQAGIQVVDLPAGNLELTLNEILLTGQLTHQTDRAEALVTQLRAREAAVKAKVTSAAPVTVYLEVDDSTPGKPYVAGKGSFGDELLTDAGGKNIFGDVVAPSTDPQVSDEAILSANPQEVILTEDPSYGGDPAAFAQRPGYSVLDAVKNQRVYVIESNPVSRPGPRLIDALEQIAKLLHPDLFK